MIKIKVPDKIQKRIVNRAITGLLNNTNDDIFVKNFRKVFDNCNGDIHPKGYCSDCKVSIPTMMLVNRKQYKDAKFKNVLICRVCGRQTRYKNKILKKIYMTVLTFLVLMVLSLIFYVWVIFNAK